MGSILITGANGLAGAHLACYLRNHHPQVDLWGSVRKKGNIGLLKYLLGAEFNNIKLLECDFTDPRSVKQLLRAHAFEKVFHFAALVPIVISIKNPGQTLTTNLNGTLYLLEEIRRHAAETTLIIAGSSDEYGLIRAEDNPVNEDCPLRPLNPYGVSKAAQSLLCWQYHKSYGLPIMRSRTFSYTGPGQNPLFACSSFARQLALIEKKGLEPVIRVGNLDAFRDYLDIRDIVRGYWLLSEKGIPGEVYNVCSARSVRMQEILDKLLRLCSIKIRVEIDPARVRPSDIPEVCGDNSKIRACTGWKPEIPLQQTLSDVYAYWRRNVI